MTQIAYQFATQALGMGQLDQADGLFRSIPASPRDIPTPLPASR